METVRKIDRLKAEAKELGLTHSPNIGVDTLEAKIRRFKAEKARETTQTVDVREAAIRKATRLRRVIVHCLESSALSEQREGEYVMASNSVIGTIKKFVPYGHPVHVEQCLLNVLEEKKFQQRYGKNNMLVREAKKFNIDILPDLTPEEAEELKKVQALRAEADRHDL